MNTEHETNLPAAAGVTEAATGSDHSPALHRRGFVLAALSAPALAVAAVGAQAVQASQAGQTEAPQSVPETPGDGGYHETEHIRRYYALAAY